MRYIICLVALAIITVVVGVGSAGTTAMAGGVTSDTTGTGAVTGSAYEFNYDGSTEASTGYLEADINALAYAKGKSSAIVTTKVPTLQSLSKTYGDADLAVSAMGTTYVKAEGKSSAASVASYAAIHSYAWSGEDLILNSREIGGHAYIASLIGNAETQNGLTVFSLSKPVGSFYAESSANGLAKYYAKARYSTQDMNAGSEISGSVEGKTTLEGEVTSDHAEIAGIVADMNSMESIWNTIETVEWMKDTEIFNAPPFNAPPFNSPLIAAIASGSVSELTMTQNMLQPGHVAGGVANIILVGAINDGIPADTSSYAAGTVEDTKATASGRLQYNPWEEEYKVSATKSAKMSADVRVLKALDAAAASSLLATGAYADPSRQRAGTIANTYAAAQRVNPGNMADGSDRVWGKAFISSGSWNSWAAELENGALDDQASVSGTLIQKKLESGLGSGAFLQYRKNGPVYANALILQGAGAGFPWWWWADIADAQIISAELMGPKGHTYGSSGWDGAGVSMAAKNLNVGAYDRWTNGPYAPDMISIDIADASGWFWCDGTNDLQYNGLSLGVSDPVFNPSGYGSWTGMQMTYLPSPVQRNTLVTFAATQPA